MNRLPHRPPRIQPPLRGRSAAVPPFGNPILTVVRQRPPISSGHTTIVKVVEKPACDDIHPDWIMLHKRFPGLFKVLDQPWKWLIGVIVLVSLSVILGNLL